MMSSVVLNQAAVSILDLDEGPNLQRFLSLTYELHSTCEQVTNML